MGLGFGIIGCGMIANFHARAIARVRGGEAGGLLRPCAGGRRSPGRRRPAAGPITIWTRCWPTRRSSRHHRHAQRRPPGAGRGGGQGRQARDRGKAAGNHAQRCDQIIDACRRRAWSLSTIFPSRFHDSSLEMKRAVDEGRFGRLTLGDAIVKWFRPQQYYDSGAWRGTWELDGGGALMNQAIHSVDLLTWLMGPVVEIRAQTGLLAHERIAVEDTAVATVRFANGALGVIEASTAVYPGLFEADRDSRLRGLGRDGGRRHDEVGLRQRKAARRGHPQARWPKRKAPAAGRPTPRRSAIMAHACSSATWSMRSPRNADPAIDGPEGRRSVEIILAIYKAAESGPGGQVATEKRSDAEGPRLDAKAKAAAKK